MSAEEINQTKKDIEDGKTRVEKTLLSIKHEVDAIIDQVKEQREDILNGKVPNLYDKPLLTIGEFFFMGYYTGKLINLLRSQSKRSNLPEKLI